MAHIGKIELSEAPQALALFWQAEGSFWIYNGFKIRFEKVFEVEAGAPWSPLEPPGGPWRVWRPLEAPGGRGGP